MRDEEVLELRDKTSHIVHALDPELHFHDFRVLKENEQKNLILTLLFQILIQKKTQTALCTSL